MRLACHQACTTLSPAQAQTQALPSREILHMRATNPTSATDVNKQSCTYNAASHSAAYHSLQESSAAFKHRRSGSGGESREHLYEPPCPYLPYCRHQQLSCFPAIPIWSISSSPIATCRNIVSGRMHAGGMFLVVRNTMTDAMLRQQHGCAEVL